MSVKDDITIPANRKISRKEPLMTKPKPKPLGSSIEVADGARVIRPGSTEANARTIAGGVYVLDVPGVHTIDGIAYEAADDREPALVEPKV